MSLKERKEKIENIHRLIQDLRAAAVEIIKPYIDGWEQWFEYVCTPFWDCPDSPVGWCVYNHSTEPAHDNCIFCGEPEERK